MGVYSAIDDIEFKLGELKQIDDAYEIEIYDKKKEDKIYIKSPKLYVRKNDYYETSLESEQFYIGLKKMEDLIKKLLFLSDELPFNEKSLSELYRSFLSTPPSVKMCPFIELKKDKNVIIYDKNNIQNDGLKIDYGDKIQAIFGVDKIKFNRSKWEIVLKLEALKPIAENSQLSEYMFRNSDDYTNMILDTECV